MLKTSPRSLNELFPGSPQPPVPSPRSLQVPETPQQSNFGAQASAEPPGMQELREVPHAGEATRLFEDCLQNFTLQFRMHAESAAKGGSRGQFGSVAKARSTLRSISAKLQPRKLLPSSSRCLQDGARRFQGDPRRRLPSSDAGEPDKFLQGRHPRSKVSAGSASQVSASSACCSHKAEPGCGDANNTQACHRPTNKNLT